MKKFLRLCGLLSMFKLFGLMPMSFSVDGDGGGDADDNKVGDDKGSAGGNDDEMSSGEMRKELAKLRREGGERRTTNKKLSDRIEELEEKERKAKEKAAKDNGEFETLYKTADELAKSLEEENNASNGALQKYLDREMEGLTDGMKKLIPNGSIAYQLDWLLGAKKEGMMGGSSTPGVKEGGEGGEGNSVTRQAFDQMTPANKQAHVAGGGKIHD